MWWLIGAALAAPEREPEPVDETVDAEIIDVQGVRPDGADPLATSAMVTVIEVDERLPASADVGRAVDQASGATVVQLGGIGDLSAVSLRGSALRQVEVMLDGVSLNPDGAATVNLSELPLSAFRRIEVYRGNAPPELGAAPIGGVVNLVTGEPRAPASASLAYGAWHTARLSGLAHLAGDGADGLLLVDGLSTRGDFTYFDDNGTVYNMLDDRLRARDNNDKRQLSAHGRVRLGDDDARLTVLDAVLVREEGLPGPSVSPTEQVRLATMRHLGVLQADGRAGVARGRARLWLQQRYETLDDRSGELGVDEGWDRTATSSVGMHVHGAVAPSAHAVPALTGSVRRDSSADRDLVDDTRTAPLSRWAMTGAVSAELAALSDRVRLSPVVQGTWLIGDGGDGIGAITAAALPRVGALVLPWSWLALKGNAGTYLRPPNLTELFGDRGLSIGNPELRPERGWQADVGVRAEPSEVLGLDAATYWRRAEDAIVVVQNAQGIQVPTNFGETWVHGVELSLTLTGLWLDSQSNATHTVSRNLTPRAEVANNPVPRVPAWELSQATSVHHQDRVRVGHSWTYAAGTTLDATAFYLTPPRSLHSVFVRTRPTRLDLSVEASVLNVGNTRVQVVDRNPLDPADAARVVAAQADFSGYPLAGRTWMFSVRYVPGTDDTPP